MANLYLFTDSNMILQCYQGTYTPTDEEFARYDHEKFDYHTVLLTGYGIDEYGNAYWELQESYGDSLGDNGFVRIARHQRLIEEMVELKVNNIYIYISRNEHFICVLDIYVFFVVL